MGVVDNAGQPGWVTTWLTGAGATSAADAARGSRSGASTRPQPGSERSAPGLAHAAPRGLHRARAAVRPFDPVAAPGCPQSAELARSALGHVSQGEQEVLGPDEVMPAGARLLLGVDEDHPAAVSEALEHDGNARGGWSRGGGVLWRRPACHREKRPRRLTAPCSEQCEGRWFQARGPSRAQHRAVHGSPAVGLRTDTH